MRTNDFYLRAAMHKKKTKKKQQTKKKKKPSERSERVSFFDASQLFLTAYYLFIIMQLLANTEFHTYGDSLILLCASCSAHKNHVIGRISARTFRGHAIVFQSMDQVKRYDSL